MKCCNQFYKWDDRNKDLASVVISSILLLFLLIVGIFYRLGAIHHVGLGKGSNNAYQALNTLLHVRYCLACGDENIQTCTET